MIPWLIFAVVAVPLVVVGFLSVRSPDDVRRASGGRGCRVARAHGARVRRGRGVRDAVARGEQGPPPRADSVGGARVRSRRAAGLGSRPCADRRRRDARAGTSQLGRSGAPRRAARLHAVLGRRASQPERNRQRRDVGGDRAPRAGDCVDPGRSGRHHAPEPRAARDRGAVRNAGGTASGQDRSRSRARAGNRPGDAARSPAGPRRRLVSAGRPRATGAAR